MKKIEEKQMNEKIMKFFRCDENINLYPFSQKSNEELLKIIENVISDINSIFFQWKFNLMLDNTGWTASFFNYNNNFVAFSDKPNIAILRVLYRTIKGVNII